MCGVHLIYCLSFSSQEGKNVLTQRVGLRARIFSALCGKSQLTKCSQVLLKRFGCLLGNRRFVLTIIFCQFALVFCRKSVVVVLQTVPVWHLSASIQNKHPVDSSCPLDIRALTGSVRHHHHFLCAVVISLVTCLEFLSNPNVFANSCHLPRWDLLFGHSFGNQALIAVKVL